MSLQLGLSGRQFAIVLFVITQLCQNSDAAVVAGAALGAARRRASNPACKRPKAISKHSAVEPDRWRPARACLCRPCPNPTADPAPTVAVAAGAACAQRFDAAENCTGFQPEGQVTDVSFLGQVRYATLGNNRIAYRRISAGAPAGATPLVLLMG